MGPIDHDSVDEANILNRWIGRHWSDSVVIPFDVESPDWTVLALQVLNLSDAAIAGLDAGLDEIEMDGEDASSGESVSAIAEDRGATVAVNSFDAGSLASTPVDTMV
jgi:hypothetical protein